MEPVLAEETIVRRPPEAQAIIRALLARIAALEAKVDELRRQGKGKTPQNSSLPPSTQHPHAKSSSREDGTGTPLENTGNSRFFVEGAANSGAVADVGVLAAELARIVAVWPMLPAAIRRAMLALVECNG